MREERQTERLNSWFHVRQDSNFTEKEQQDGAALPWVHLKRPVNSQRTQLFLLLPSSTLVEEVTCLLHWTTCQSSSKHCMFTRGYNENDKRENTATKPPFSPSRPVWWCHIKFTITAIPKVHALQTAACVYGTGSSSHIYSWNTFAKFPAWQQPLLHLHS